MKLRILPYKHYSKSARKLVCSLSPQAILKKQLTPVYGRNKVLLNWGNSNPKFNLSGVVVLNNPVAVKVASNKLASLIKLKESGIRVPDFTTDINEAKQWIDNQRIVLCRTLLKSNSGKGIVIAKTHNELIPAPLYVKYIRKEKEYRLHVFKGKVIDYVEKRRRRGFQESSVYNKYIRSYEQGWVFVREGVEIAADLNLAAIRAVEILGLDFGAVDIVINRNNEPVVLEVNTAPGLQGSTLESYKQAIKEWLNEF